MDGKCFSSLSKVLAFLCVREVCLFKTVYRDHINKTVLERNIHNFSTWDNVGFSTIYCYGFDRICTRNVLGT